MQKGIPIPVSVSLVNNAATTRVDTTLGFARINGIVEEICMRYPTTPYQDKGFYYGKLTDICPNPLLIIKIPAYRILSINSDQALQRAIMDNGPIVVTLEDFETSKYSCAGGGHSVLVIGWTTVGTQVIWQVKDSWQYLNAIWNIDFLHGKTLIDRAKKYYAIVHNISNNQITCSGTNCSNYFTSRSFSDADGDGFYYWGIGPKPAGCPGPCLMDYNDNLVTGKDIICINNNYNPQPTPKITGPGEYVCQSGTFTLNNVPQNFFVSWAVSPASYFSSPTSGNSNVATVYPSAQSIGKLCTITFTLNHNTDHCTVQYSKSFVINGPREDQIDITAEKGSGGAPPRNGTVWVLCPNKTYYLYLKNTSNCATSGYTWVLPSGWTKYYQTDNYVSINTNSSPGGIVKVYANTCCGNKLIRTQIFGSGYCSSSSMINDEPLKTLSPISVLYPNPLDKDKALRITLGTDVDAGSAVLQIFTIKGEAVYRSNKAVDNLFELLPGHLQPGMYIIHVSSVTGSFRDKLIVQ